MLKFDRSRETGILITCVECDFWFAYRFDMGEAYDSAINHAGMAHEATSEVARLQTARANYRSRNVNTSAEDARHGSNGPTIPAH